MATQEYIMIQNLCRQAGIEITVMEKAGEYLLKHYYQAKRTRAYSMRMQATSSRDVKYEKQKIRREYLLVVKGASKKDQNALIWDALSTNWIDEKIEMIIEEVGSLADSEDIGNVYKAILRETYLSEGSLKGERLYAACGVGRSAYYSRKKEAIILFGVLMYNYAKRRENEDVEAGVIDATERLA